MQNASTVDNESGVIPGHSKKCLLSCNLMKTTQDKKGLLKIHPVECLEHMPTCLARVWIKGNLAFSEVCFSLSWTPCLIKGNYNCLGHLLWLSFKVAELI